MSGPIHRYMSADHARIDALLDHGDYDAFRGALLRHIGMEEKVLFPALREAAGGVPHPWAARLHRDHGAIVRLLVRAPSEAVTIRLRALLEPHDKLEEDPDGVYDACDALTPETIEKLLTRCVATPVPPLMPYYDGPILPPL